MPFIAEFVTTRQIREGGQWGTGDRVTEYRVGTIQVFNADRRMAQTWRISANTSAQAIALGPLGASAPGAVMFMECSDPVDVRFQSATDAIYLPAVRQLLMGGTVSALYVSTGSAAALTTIQVDMIGGSATSITTSIPYS